MLLSGLSCLFLLGCPTYEDEFTGRYQEVELDELQDEALLLDFFRFGSEVRAVMRRYNIASATARQDPFHTSNEVECRWTRVDRFDEETGQFSLTIPATARQPRVELQGTLSAGGSMELTVQEDAQDQARQLQLSAGQEPPNPDCQTIDDFFLRAAFGDRNNEFDRQVYELRNPVFALLWVGVEPVFRDGTLVMIGFNRAEPAVRLERGAQFNPGANGLRASLSVAIPPPSDRILVESGSTRYALAHFVVIDDAPDQTGRFSWEIDAEPIVATALEAGTPENLPNNIDPEDIRGWGKALLFVEGSLLELDPALRAQFDGLHQAEPDRHFYIVDIFFYNDAHGEDGEVRSLRLPPRPEPDKPVQRRVSLQLTERYLEATEVLLPRLFPIN